MKELRYTLLSDGSSDRALFPLLTWLLREHGVKHAIQPEWADLRRVRLKPPRELAERIVKSLELFPCDLLFVHRDAEKEPHTLRLNEAREAITRAVGVTQVPPAVCVIPIRMQEAWLLFDIAALRRAAGNPHGRQPISLPHINALEELADPKGTLYKLLREASGLTGRHLRRLAIDTCARRVTEFVDTFAPLRKLVAFKVLEADVRSTVKEQGWVS